MILLNTACSFSKAIKCPIGDRDEAIVARGHPAAIRAISGRRSGRTTVRCRTAREILDVQTEDWGVEVTLVELQDIQLPDSMKRAMAKQAEAEREKRAKIIAAEGEALAAGELANASDIMMAHPLALQLRNLQTLIEISVEKNSTTVFPAPLTSTIQESRAFLRHEGEGAQADVGAAPAAPVANGSGAPMR